MATKKTGENKSTTGKVRIVKKYNKLHTRQNPTIFSGISSNISRPIAKRVSINIK